MLGLLVLRDIIFFGKHTFKGFLASSDRITTSVLTDRLSSIEKNRILTKQPHQTDLRRAVYVLTEKGLSLVPILLDMMEWGTTHDPKSAGQKKGLVARIRNEQSALSREVQSKIRNGDSPFARGLIRQLLSQHV